MGINLQWEGEKGNVLERVIDERDLVEQIVAAGGGGASTCLRFIDPYGDTVFNSIQIPVFIAEVRAIPDASLSIEAKRHREKIIALAEKTQSRGHTYLKFYGD